MRVIIPFRLRESEPSRRTVTESAGKRAGISRYPGSKRFARKGTETTPSRRSEQKLPQAALANVPLEARWFRPTALLRADHAGSGRPRSFEPTSWLKPTAFLRSRSGWLEPTALRWVNRAPRADHPGSSRTCSIGSNAPLADHAGSSRPRSRRCVALAWPTALLKANRAPSSGRVRSFRRTALPHQAEYGSSGGPRSPGAPRT